MNFIEFLFSLGDKNNLTCDNLDEQKLGGCLYSQGPSFHN